MRLCYKNMLSVIQCWKIPIQLLGTGDYRTLTSPIRHNGQVIGNLPVCKANGANARQFVHTADTGWRKRSQIKFIKNHPEIIRHIRNTISRDLCEYTWMVEEVLEHVDDPHEKRMLRRQAFIELEATGKLHAQAWNLWKKKVLLKSKKYEWAKIGKTIRMIGDFGVEPSLQGFRLFEVIKNATAKNDVLLEHEGITGLMRFVKKPDYDALKDVFHLLINPKHNFYLFYHSDDSVVGIRVEGKWHTFNMDISKCDASHGPIIFKQLLEILPEHMRADMQRCLDQTLAPMDISRPRTFSFQDAKRVGKTEKAKIHPLVYNLSSGWSGTTMINNLACLLMGYAIYLRLLAGKIRTATIVSDIMEATRESGYNVTLEENEIPEDIQFLKNSPVLNTDGEYVPFFNIGAWLRSVGTVNGDLAGSGSILERAEDDQFARTVGTYPNSFFTLRNRMYERFKHRATSKQLFKHQAKFEARNRYKSFHKVTNHFHDHDIYRRYRLTSWHIAGVNAYADTPIGYSYAHQGVSRILERDYGLTIPLFDDK